MKDLKDKLFESKAEDLLSEVQNETGDKAEYHTFDFKNGKKKFKKGFLTFNEDGEFITLTCFNTSKDLADLIGADEDIYKAYDDVNIGECDNIKDNDGTETQIMRIW